MAKKKLRPVGKILLDLEPLLFELVEKHELQKGDVLALVSVWIDTHYPEAIEEYYDDSNPVEYYGHREGLEKYLCTLKK